MPRADWNSMGKVELQIPPLPEQRAIASILSNIDDKIENNLAMNKTLEEMAMALYKHWFVDFGPFQEGNFVESELGEIPEGWEVKELKDVAKVNQRSLKKDHSFNEINYIDISSVGTGLVENNNIIESGKAPSRAKRQSTRLNSSHVRISYAVFCLKKKKLIIFLFLLILSLHLPSSHV